MIRTVLTEGPPQLGAIVSAATWWGAVHAGLVVCARSKHVGRYESCMLLLEWCKHALAVSSFCAGNPNSTSARGFDVTPLLNYAAEHRLYDAEPEVIYGRWVDAKVAAAMSSLPAADTGACGYNRPCAHQYVGKSKSSML